MKSRKVLLVSYYFPPMGGSGVQRAAGLAEFLPGMGWETHVLCAEHRHYGLHDESLSDGLDQSRIHRIPGFEPAGLAARLGRLTSSMGRHEQKIFWRADNLIARLNFPEVQMLWTASATRAAKHLIADLGIDAIITTSPPHCVQSVGRRLQASVGIPWIADLRDPILDNFEFAPRTKRHDRYWRDLEHNVVQKADSVVVTCGDLRQKLHSRYEQRARFISVIHNGFDPADAPTTRPSNKEPWLVISHVGSFHGRQSIGPVLDALRPMAIELGQAIKFRQVGSVSAAQRSFFRPEDNVYCEQTEYVPHAAAIAEMASADVLLLVTPDHAGGRYCIPAKTFEYLAFGGHIVAVVHPRTELAAILRRAGNVTLVEDHAPEVLRRAIQNCRERWLSGALQSERDMEFVFRFQRDRQADVYADLLEAAVTHKTRTCELDSFDSTRAALQGVA